MGCENMNPITDNELKSNWLKKENEQLMQRRRRRYLHFDEILESVSTSTVKKITNPKFIEKYGFFPLIQSIQKSRLYKRDPVTKKKIIKTKNRPISYPAHFDALIYSWYAEQLEVPYEKKVKEVGLNDNVIAYRQLGKSNVTFAKEVFDFIKTQDNTVAIALDIKGFYDTLDFASLKKSWARILSRADLPPDHYQVYKTVTKFSYVDIGDIKKLLNIGMGEYKKLRFFLNINILGALRSEGKIKTNADRGIPQGTPISCILSNLYMLDFDRAVVAEISKYAGLYRRYSDDIIVVCPADKVEHIKKYLNEEISEIKLAVEEAKTEIKSFMRSENGVLSCSDEKGKKSKLQYLGVEFDGQHTTLRHKGYAKFERKMTRIIRGEVENAHELGFAVAKRKIYEKFTTLGKTNYPGYAMRASQELGSNLIQKPVKSMRLFKKVKQKITKAQKEVQKKASH